LPKVSVIVLNWNGMGYVEECLDSLLDQTYRDFELIVVDNGSTDGSLELIKKWFEGARNVGARHVEDPAKRRAVSLLENGRNLGYAAGNNRGIEKANGDWIALFNNDAVADRLWLERLMEAVESKTRRSEGGDAVKSRVGMAASKILFYDRRDVIDNTGHLIYPDGLNRGRGRLERDAGQYDSLAEALFPSGCAGFYSREMLNEIGLLDEDFFAYGEDADLGLRGRLSGWRCIFVPQAKVYHRYSAGAGAYSKLKAYHVERNRVWVMVKNFPVSVIITSPGYTLLRYCLQAYGALFGKGAAGEYTRSEGRLSLLAVLIRALAAAVAGLGRMMVKRREIRRKARLSGRRMSNLLKEHRISSREVALND